MARKVIIDCDPGIYDAVALAMALFDARLEVVGITAVAGNVPAEQATRNVQAILDQLDPPRLPRVGTATASNHEQARSAWHIHGGDGLGNAGFRVAELHQAHPSEKVICDLVRNAPGELTILCLGPLTNVARAIRLDPDLPNMIDRLVIVGGSVAVGGDVTAAAEFNMHCDPSSARHVFHSATTKTLIPLDATQQAVFSLELLEELPGEESRAGRFLRKVIPFLFRSYRQHFGLEGIHLPDAVATIAVTQPGLFETHELEGDVETSGEITTGATIFDRRPGTRGHSDLEVAVSLEVESVHASIIRSLRHAGHCTSPSD